MTEYQRLKNELPAGTPPLKIVRRKNQRSIRIRIDDEQLLLSAPTAVSSSRIADFVKEKAGWIHKICEKRKQRNAQLSRLRESVRGTLLLRGERKPVYSFPVRSLRKPLLVEHDHAVIYQYEAAPNEPEPVTPDCTTVLDFYRKLAKTELPQAFDSQVSRLPFQPARLSIRNQKTKWGSCSSRGTISLNWRLVKCPTDIRDYIIIHELCHLKHFNHSRSFWNTVRKYYPDVDGAKSWIRTNSDIIFSDI